MAEAGTNGRSDEGAWIFVSHSHRDLSEVRRVRDAFEAEGHQPLLFFLKCLGDDAELDDLLRREIEARQFFVLCDSPNARASRYVRQEVGFIKDLADKVRVDLALDGDWQAQLEAIAEISRRATVFLSYSSQNEASMLLAPALASALRARDYRVFLDIESLQAGANWADRTRRALDSALEKGFVVVLLSPESITSQFVVEEVQHALKRHVELGRKSRVVPIIASQRYLTIAALHASSEFEPITRMQLVDFTVDPLDDNIDELIRILARL